MGQKKKRIIRASYLAFLTFVCMLNAASLFARSGNEMRWEQVEPGVWKGTFGTPEDYSLLEASGAESLEEGFLSLPDVEIPALHADITATVQGGKTYLSIPLEKKEQIYGLGLNFQSVFQRGKVLNLHVDHYGGRDDGRTHAPVPFYVSSRGYGILVNSARYLTVYAGSGIRKDSPHAEKAKDRNTDKSWTVQPYSDAVSILIPTEGVEVYLFAGPAPLDVVRRYNLLCGGGVLPPRWGLGFTQRTPTLYTSAQVEKEVDDFERYGYPLDFIGLEPGFGPEGIAASRGKEQNLEENPYLETVAKEIRDQYMAGEYLLVAPMFVGETSRKVVLPEGNWYDFYTGDYVGNGETITVSPGLERIPVFVKDGGIIPMMEAVLHAPRSGQKVNLEIRHYGKSDGACRLYDDDGETYDYEKGVCSWRNIKVKRQKNGKLKGSISKSESGKPDSVNKVTWVFMTEGNEPSEL